MRHRTAGRTAPVPVLAFAAVLALAPPPNPAVAQSWPSTALWSAALSAAEGEGSKGGLEVGAPAELADAPGYDNQPFFLADGSGFLFTSERSADETEIFRYDFASTTATRLTDTRESEYSPTPLPDGGGFSTVRVEPDGTQRLWRFDLDGANPRLLVEKLAPVGYHAWAGRDAPGRFVAFVLGDPNTLQYVADAGAAPRVMARNIGRALHRVPGRDAWSFVAPNPADPASPAQPAQSAPAADTAEPGKAWVWILPFDGGEPRAFAPAFTAEGDHDLAWTPQGVLLMSQGSRVGRWDTTSQKWLVARDFASDGIDGITRLAVSPAGDRLVFVAREADPRTAQQRFLAGREAFGESEAAKGRGDWRAARHALDRAAKWLPPQAGLTRRRAGAAARDGRPEEGYGFAETLVSWAIDVDLAAHPDLEPLRGPRLDALNARLALARAAKEVSSVAFTAGAGDFVAEGVTHDPATGAFFVGSLRRGVVVRRAADGSEAVVADVRRQGYGSVVGMAIDSGRRLLYVAASDLPPADNFVAGEKTPRKTALCAFALDAVALESARGCWLPPAGAEGARFDDVAVAADGTVYVSDGAPAIRVLRPGAKALETFLGADAVAGPNGLALSTTEDALYVADYAMGLLRVERTSGKVEALAAPGLPPLVGIDGLARWRRSLIAVQNGIAPPRILRIDLEEDGSVGAVETLERAVAAWDEPTLGVVAGGDYLYVSNSHWPRFGDDGALRPGPPLDAPVIRRIDAAALGAEGVR
jgi:hypothetical protein